MRKPLTVGRIGCLLIGVVLGCSKSGSQYDQLCRLYQEVEGQPTTPELAMKITARAEKEIPALGEDLMLLANASADQRYELLRMMAQQKAGQADWKCEAIKKWYPPRASQ